MNGENTMAIEIKKVTPTMTKGDEYTRYLFQKILDEGCLDKDPRPHYADGTPAHTLSINHEMCKYDLSKGEFPLITLRPIAVKSAIGELLWIYQDATSNLYTLETKYGIRWWREWCINPMHYDENGTLQNGANPYCGNHYYYDCTGKYCKIGTKSETVDSTTDMDKNENIVDFKSGNVLTKDASIGACYGDTVNKHNLMKNLLNGIQDNADGRRHIINMWQEEDFKNPHGLKPCAYQTVWNVRHGKDGVDYLDMCLFQRSSDFATAGCINQVQYAIFLYMVARHCGYTPGYFTWMVDNIQIYDRHIEQVNEMLQRESINCMPKVMINPEKTNFYDFTVDDIKIVDYPLKDIKEKNPQLKFDLGI